MASSGCILHFGLFQDLLTEITAEIFGRAQVDLSAALKIRQLQFHASEIEEGWESVGLKFDQHVDIALRAEIVTQG